ncbi:MAG: hypothetical protein K6F07_00290 [Bacilli bacterium]|nr:hypothetical protein [Bacilli bacterium]
MRMNDFDKYKLPADKKNPFCDLYQLENGERFYIEPVFHTQLQGFFDLRNNEYHRIVERMLEVVRKNKKVVFVGNFEFPQTEVEEGYIFLEITDITDPLQIYVEDKSRGSDYGD